MLTIQALPKETSAKLKVSSPKTFMKKVVGLLGNRTVQAKVAIATTAAFVASNSNLSLEANQSTELMLHPTANLVSIPGTFIDFDSLFNTGITVDLNAPLRQATSVVKSAALFSSFITSNPFNQKLPLLKPIEDSCVNCTQPIYERFIFDPEVAKAILIEFRKFTDRYFPA